MKSNLTFMVAFVIFFSMAGQGTAQTPAPKTSDQTKNTHAKKAVEPAASVTEKDIEDARAKGMVWVPP